MKTDLCKRLTVVLVCLTAWTAMAQQSAVPNLISYKGVLKDTSGKAIATVAGVTFLLYKDQQGGAPLWLETQNVTPDKMGRYTVQLGVTSTHGLPSDLFQTGEARWLGVQVANEPEQPRVLLVAVPYALKAADAETVGGLPPSAFVLAGLPPTASNTAAVEGSASSPSSPSPLVPSTVTTSGGTANTIPLFTTATNIQNSAITQTGSGSTAKIGINTTTPAVTLDVKGAASVRGTFTLPATGTATATGGKNSQPDLFLASAFNSGTLTAVTQKFQWQAEAANNNTVNASGTLNLLYGSGSANPAETGLKINSKGLLTFATGQSFPGTGPGTVKSVALSAPSSDFTVSGSPVTSTGTLGLAWTVAPTSANTANAIVKRDSNGAFVAGVLFADQLHAGLGGQSGTYGVSGAVSVNGGGVGVYGYGDYGVRGEGIYHYGVWGTSAGLDGVHGESASYSAAGVAASNTGGGDSLYAENLSGGYAGYFYGDVYVNGNLGKAGGSFKIDHPLDPANKYLYHSFVESPDMMNIYNGETVLDANGQVVITLPEWFGRLNRDFRYQLTAIGAPGPNLYIAEKIHNNNFKIAGGQPGMEVSWQVTGIRQDAWANAHRIPVEESKPVRERGFYLHPELFGASEEKSIVWARHPGVMKQRRENRAKLAIADERQAPVKR
jgi:hypothetical protein